MLIQYDDRTFNVDAMSIGLHAIAFTGFLASIWDGLAPAAVGMLILIYDVIRSPYPNIMDVTDEVESDGDDDMAAS